MAEAMPANNNPLLLDLLALGNFVIGMGAFVVIGIITPVSEGLAVSKADTGIILTAYALAYALLAPVGTALTGRFPRRTVLTGALLLFCGGSVMSALAWSLPVLTASRILVAFGAALFTPLAAGVAVDVSRPEQRGRALAKVFGGITLAQVVGVPFGAWLAYRFGWNATFWVVAALAALTASILFLAIPRGAHSQAAPVTAILTAMGNFRLMLAVTFTATILSAIYVVFTYFGPLIEASAGKNPEIRTFYLVLFGLGAVAGNMIGGYLSDRIGPRRTLVIVCIAQVLIMPLFSYIPWHPVLFAMLVAIWSSFGWSFMAPQQSRLVAAAPEVQALSLGLNAAMIYVGIAIGSGIGSGLLNWQGLTALGISGGLMALVALAHLLVSERQRRSP